jgi:hypothetical protein
MLKPGQIVGGGALEAGSMAAAIEAAMVAQGVLKLEDETAEAAENRRKALIAIATGVIDHLRSRLEIVVAANQFGNVPAAQTVLDAAAGAVR